MQKLTDTRVRTLGRQLARRHPHSLCRNHCGVSRIITKLGIAWHAYIQGTQLLALGQTFRQLLYLAFKFLAHH